MKYQTLQSTGSKADTIQAIGQIVSIGELVQVHIRLIAMCVIRMHLI